MLNFDEHRENLQKLIKMMEGIHNESIIDNQSREMLDNESERYISYEILLSIRELSKMFIEELNSRYMQCAEGDVIVQFIKDMIQWLQLAYNFTIEKNSGGTGVKSLKICNQVLNDYKRVYNEAHTSNVVKESCGKIFVEVIEFGKINKTSNSYLNENPLNIDIVITGDKVKNGFTHESLEKIIKKVVNKIDKSNENNIYLSKKERNVIRNQIEKVLNDFERIVDDHLCKNELELAKADHNVVMVARSILSKFDVADCNDIVN